MNLQDYSDLSQLLSLRPSNREANRAFGLAHQKFTPLEQLLRWREAHASSHLDTFSSGMFARYQYGIGLMMGVVAFVAGVLSGAALLSYSGREPVNVIYFLAMAVAVPLVTMVLALLSMIRADNAHNVLVHLSPASWMEKIIQLFPSIAKEKISSLYIHPRLANWLIIEHAQMMAFWFAFGLLLSLLGIVVTRDIAFAWSTTLQVTPEQFHGWLEMLSTPWRSWLPSAVPSAALIEQSQYYRLGGTLDTQMIHRAARLGEWWKFLTAATLFYAVGLRLVIWIIALIGKRRALGQAMLALPGAQELLTQMNTQLVTSASPDEEAMFARDEEGYARVVAHPDAQFDTVLGWAMDSGAISVILDAIGFATGTIKEVGGTQSLTEDDAVLASTSGRVLLLVKGWEPPTMDFIDFLTDLVEQVEQVCVAPIGPADDRYVVTSDQVAVWSRKLQWVDLGKVYLWKR
jgi:hypothetical protein